jgi:uncharacterized protein (DUF58 family)
MVIAQFMLIWVVVCFVVGTAAYARGRRFWVWFLWSLILSPLVTGLLVALLPDLYLREQLQERRQRAEFQKAMVEEP